MAKKKTHEEFVSELKLKNKNFDNIELLSEYCGIKNRIKCKCKVCDYEWEPISDSLMRGYGCPMCGNERVRKARIKPLKDFLNDLYSTRDDIEYIDGYKSMKKKVTFRCKKHNVLFNTTPESALNGVTCELCRNEAPKYNQFTKEQVNDLISHLKVEIVGDYINSKTPTKFRCQLCGKEFISKYDLVRAWRTCGCVDCGGKIKSKRKIDIVNNRINRLHSEKSEYAKILSYDEECKRIKCECLLCGAIYETSYESLIQGCMHRNCASVISQSNARFSNTEVVEKVKSFGNNINIDFSNYFSSESLLDCECGVCGNKWKAKSKNLIRGRGCPICAQKRRDKSKYKSISDYSELLNNMNLSVVSDYINATTPSTFKCNVCGGTFESTMTYISNTSIGCKNCTQEKNRILKLNSFIDGLDKKNSTIKLIGDFVDMSTSTTFLCTNCNRNFERTPHDLLKSCNCPNCTTNSKLEYYIKLYLDKHKISYKLHYSFDGLYGVNGGLLSYDFYLPEYNLLIEAQGKQHVEPVEYFGGEDQFVIQTEHDKRKREYAEIKNIELLEIFYNDINNISNILDNQFNMDVEIKRAS